jgi:hypothetical protein
VKRIAQLTLTLLAVVGGLASCSSHSQMEAHVPVAYHYQPGKTALLSGGMAYAPRSAPAEVKMAVSAGNRLQNKPYKWGGGHRSHIDYGYDCSGSVSYVLDEAGLINGSLASRDLFSYGKKGPGKWITIYTKKGHAFMTVAGLRLDTGGHGGNTGPRWKPEPRSTEGYVMRHPAGF